MGWRDADEVLQRYSEYQSAQEDRIYGRLPRGRKIWPPAVGFFALPDNVLLHARFAPSAHDRYPHDPELSDAMHARFANMDRGKPLGTPSDVPAVSGADIQAARAALSGARERIVAEQGVPGRVDLHDITGGNPLAMQLLRVALGHATTRVQKRSARSAIISALDALDRVRPARAATTRSVSGDEEPNQLADHVNHESQEATGALVRRLVPEGLRRAREFLAEMRERPTAPREAPRDLLYDERYSRPFKPDVWIEHRSFRTRREAAEYFAPKFEPIRHLVADHAGVWSWLGMYYFADTVRVDEGKARLSPLDETFIVNSESTRSFQRRYRHFLWSAWRLYQNHGEDAAFLLDQNLTSLGDIADRVLSSTRIFNSEGIIQLVLRLYTKDGIQRSGFSRGPGGLRHLIRVLDQLERTFDVNGMQPESLLRVLPQEFQRWADG